MSERHDLLFELGTEELPPKSLRALSEALTGNLTAGLKAAGLEHGTVRGFATPRRLAVSIDALASVQPDRIDERRGPALSAARHPDGSPTKAAEGFARSCGVTVDELIVIGGDKGEWLGFRKPVPGTKTAALLPNLITQALADLPIAKRMRWGSGDTEFVRPVHWAVLLYGPDVIETVILGARTGRTTRGHRFHCPEPFELSTPNNYASDLERTGRVIARFDERTATIRHLATELTASVGGTPHLDADLVDEVAALVEWPVPVIGRFDPRFLALPAEVLITTLQGNQKYFPVKDAGGKLLPYFVTFSNLESRQPATVSAGNERVVTPRLSDAEFFWKQDRRRTLESRVEDLGSVTFQAKLGSLRAKGERLQQLGAFIAAATGHDVTLVERAARLAKADLLTEMVGEFPNLQGIMGRYYALAEGEPDEVAAAIEEHYRPRQSGGALPDTLPGRMLAVADKIDTLAGIFSVGLLPSGDRDPYGLRRAALGVIRIILERQVDLDLHALVRKALSLFDHAFDAEKTSAAVIEFVAERLRGHFLDQKWRPDEIESVLSLGLGRPLDSERRLRAVADFRRLPAAESLAAANKRIRNLLRKSDGEAVGTVEPTLLVDGAETALFAAARRAHEDILPLLQRGEYGASLSRLAELGEPVDRFFEEVLVMAEDEAIRRNRLGLLALVEQLFLHIADIGKLQP